MALAITSQAAAYEVSPVCATYLGTGAKYKVEAQIMDGSELNDRAETYRFSSYSKYVLIWWADGQVTIIELDYSFGPSAIGSEGTDQNGYRWEVAKTRYCL